VQDIEQTREARRASEQIEHAEFKARLATMATAIRINRM